MVRVIPDGYLQRFTTWRVASSGSKCRRAPSITETGHHYLSIVERCIVRFGVVSLAILPPAAVSMPDTGDAFARGGTAFPFLSLHSP